MTIDQDGSDQPFVDTPTLLNEHIRTTLVRADRAGHHADSIRIQIREENGHLRHGPEVPLETVPEVIRAMVELVREA